MNRIQCTLMLLLAFWNACAQMAKPVSYHIVIDAAHKQTFWGDPKFLFVMNRDLEPDRVKYLNAEISKTAASVNADVAYLNSAIKPADLAKADLLFIHVPAAQYTPPEVDAITAFVKTGGSLFLVMEEDYWSTLKKTNVNDLVRPFGIQFGGTNPDKFSGGHTRAGLITPKPLKISYHGARIVTGGTPFCFNDRTEKFPFGVFLATQTGGKIIAMGEGMTSLYMTSWENVNDYQCSEFMRDTFEWLLK